MHFYGVLSNFLWLDGVGFALDIIAQYNWENALLQHW